jgi:hypothetical protein
MGASWMPTLQEWQQVQQHMALCEQQLVLSQKQLGESQVQQAAISDALQRMQEDHAIAIAALQVSD